MTRAALSKLSLLAAVAAVTALGEIAELWLNNTPAGNHWLDVKLVGKKSNRDGIGAVVRIGKQYNPMTSAFGYASSSHGPVHFGLGKSSVPPEVEVRWPSGKVQIVRPKFIDQVLTVVEPD